MIAVYQCSLDTTESGLPSKIPSQSVLRALEDELAGELIGFERCIYNPRGLLCVVTKLFMIILFAASIAAYKKRCGHSVDWLQNNVKHNASLIHRTYHSRFGRSLVKRLRIAIVVVHSQNVVTFMTELLTHLVFPHHESARDWMGMHNSRMAILCMWLSGTIQRVYEKRFQIELMYEANTSKFLSQRHTFPSM